MYFDSRWSETPCPVCKGELRAYDPKLKAFVTCPHCVTMKPEMECSGKYFRKKATMVNGVDGTGRYAGYGTIEDHYEVNESYVDDTPSGYRPTFRYDEMGVRWPEEGLRTYNKVYKMVNGEMVLDRVEIMEMYHKLTKEGKKSSRWSWRVIKKIPVAEVDWGKLPKEVIACV